MATTDQHQTPSEVHRLLDPASGLDGAIVLHSTVLGPAAGGCRLWHYADPQAMIADGIRLAEGMSYKNAMAGLPLGGGKAVLMRPTQNFDRAAMFAAFGRAVRDLGGRYVTAEDVGTCVDDMRIAAGATRHVAGLPSRAGRPGGDPSPWTARGVFLAMRIAAERRLGRPIAECTVAVQGVGHVGAALAELLHAEGARLVIADTDSAAVARTATATGAEVASVRGILSATADILAPCALGGVLSHATVGRLAARVVCGAANNQLATPEDGSRLADAGILYTPDYVVNAGGIINVAAEYLGWDGAEAQARVDAIPDRLSGILDHAAERSLATNVAADALARGIIAERAAAQRDAA